MDERKATSRVILIVVATAIIVLALGIQFNKHFNQESDEIEGKVEYRFATQAEADDSVAVWKPIEYFFPAEPVSKPDEQGIFWKEFREKENDEDFVAVTNSLGFIFIKTKTDLPKQLSIGSETTVNYQKTKIILLTDREHLYVAAMPKK